MASLEQIEGCNSEMIITRWAARLGERTLALFAHRQIEIKEMALVFTYLPDGVIRVYFRVSSTDLRGWSTEIRNGPEATALDPDVVVSRLQALMDTKENEF